MTLHVVRVFVGEDRRGGNPLGVFLDGGLVARDRRQEIARALGFSETVWVEDSNVDGATIAIHTPGTELEFAGHPCVGTSWLLRSIGRPVGRLRVRAGDVVTFAGGDLTWIRGYARWVHPIVVERLASAAEVDAVAPPAMGETGRYVWAWDDEASGHIRARYFPTDLGIAEDEATGAAAVLMGDRLGRALVIRQGVGSQLFVRPGPDGSVEVGGRTELLEVREDVRAD